MRVITVALAAALALGVPAAAESDWQATTGGWVSGPVEHLTTLPVEAGTASDAVLHDGYLYVTTWRSFSIYDVSDPTAPDRVATVHLGPSAYNEAPQTNGELLLISRDLRWGPTVAGEPFGGVLEIYDVKDKSDPQRIGRYITPAGQFDHLWTCLLDCTYAYSAYGSIVDLTDPTQPKKVGTWHDVITPRPRLSHFLSEVAPGIVLTGSVPMYLLDVREDPLVPEVLLRIDPETTNPGGPFVPESIPARTAWPDDATDRFLTVAMETPFSGECTEESGPVLTFEIDQDEQGAYEVRPAGHYQITTNGTFTDGKPPANVVGCGAYGLSAHPDWGDDDGRLAAVTFFEHGVRLLALDDGGELSEIGGFLPHAGNSAAVRWLSDEILAVIDLHRGIDLLKVDLDSPHRGG